MRFSKDNQVDSARISIGEYTRIHLWHTLKECSIHSLPCSASDPLSRAGKRCIQGYLPPYCLCCMRLRYLSSLHSERVCARVEIEVTISTDKQEGGERSLCSFSSALAHMQGKLHISPSVSASVSQSVKWE